MPKQTIDVECDACGGTGLLHLTRNEWHCGGRLECRQCYSWEARDFICGVCGGDRRRSVAHWVPSSLAETKEVIREVENWRSTGSNPWPKVNAIQRAVTLIDEKTRVQLFDDEAINSLAKLRKELPSPCGRCGGQGFLRGSDGARCEGCGGTGWPPRVESGGQQMSK